MEATSCTKKLESFESHKNQFLYSFTLHSILVALASLLWYCLCGFLPLPNSLSTSFLTPKCLFIVVNIIVVFLVGESRLSGSNTSISPSTQIYEEYVERSRDFRSFSTLQQEIKPVTNTLTSQDKEVIELPQEEVKEVQEVVQVQEKSDEKEVEMEEIQELEKDDISDEEEMENCIEEESECGMATEELNRRVEEFIARVNKQRWQEARFLVCCEA